MFRRACSCGSSVSFVALLLLSVSGCGKDAAFDVAPVHGMVTIDGVPLGGGRIVFAPVAAGQVNSGKVAHGRLDANGGFTLSTYGENDGAVVGEHWVTIFRRDDEIVTAANNPATTRIPRFSRLPLPEKMRIAAKQENQVDIKLTSEQVARLGVE